MALSSIHQYPSPGKDSQEQKNENNSAMDASVMNAIAECHHLMSMISNPLNDNLKEIISKHAQNLQKRKKKKQINYNMQKFSFVGYEKNPDAQITARYKGEIIFDSNNGKISGHLIEKDTVYAMNGIYDVKTNVVSKVITKPDGEYYHLNEQSKHLAGHWDTCTWIDGRIDFKNKNIVCKNQRWKDYIEVLEWK